MQRGLDIIHWNRRNRRNTISGGAMVDEKRRFSRIFFNVSAKLTVVGRDYRIERIANLSVGGCLLEISEKLPLGSACSCTIFLSGIESGMTVHGEIVRVGNGEISVKFTSIEPENLFHLQNIIRYNAADPDAIEEEIRLIRGSDNILSVCVTILFFLANDCPIAILPVVYYPWERISAKERLYGENSCFVNQIRVDKTEIATVSCSLALCFWSIGGALSIPFVYETQTLWYKVGADKLMLRTGQMAGARCCRLVICPDTACRERKIFTAAFWCCRSDAVAPGSTGSLSLFWQSVTCF